ncbi:MAG: DUF2089 domain-containing protein [Candidatus Marinimicrobia bacterium]|nr:DUF2089 domain-containing protein [Candidatus Neomarinimicrobiota bacterium]
MIHEWQALIKMTGGKPVKVTKVEIPETGISIEGEFKLPALAQLSAEDQLFAAVFLKTHGSIKQMEKFFGISYPTVKNRLNKIGGHLDMVNIDVVIEEPEKDKEERMDILDRLGNGEISLDEALKGLE